MLYVLEACWDYLLRKQLLGGYVQTLTSDFGIFIESAFLNVEQKATLTDKSKFNILIGLLYER